MYDEAWLLNQVKAYLESRPQKSPNGMALSLVRFWRDGEFTKDILRSASETGLNTLYERIEATFRFLSRHFSESESKGNGFGNRSGRDPESDWNDVTPSEEIEYEEEGPTDDPANQGDLLSGDELSRAKAMGRYYALDAASNPEVRVFRSEVIGGTFEGNSNSLDLSYDGACLVWDKVTGAHEKATFNPDEARRLLASKALRYLGRYTLREESIRAIELSSKILDSEGEEYTDRFILQQGTLLYGCGDHQESMNLNNGVSEWKVVYLRYFQDDGWFHQIGISTGSVLGDLHHLATKLSDHYGWDEPYAAWFVLTGTVPPTTPLRAASGQSWGTINRCNVSIEVEPWVGEESVLRAYRAQQRQCIHYRDPKERKRKEDEKRKLERRFRVPFTGKNAKKSIALFDFLVEQAEAGTFLIARIHHRTEKELSEVPEDRKWLIPPQNPMTTEEFDDLLDSWRTYIDNKKLPESWRFNGGRSGSDPRNNFRNECREVLSLLLSPYRSPYG